MSARGLVERLYSLIIKRKTSQGKTLLFPLSGISIYECEPPGLVAFLKPYSCDTKDETHCLKVIVEKDEGKLLTLCPRVNKSCNHFPPYLSFQRILKKKKNN